MSKVRFGSSQHSCTDRLKETCFWIHLASSIRGSTSKTWFSSVWFKFWVIGSLMASASLFGAVAPVQDDVQQMETVSR
jgi:hypothetical protein